MRLICTVMDRCSVMVILSVSILVCDKTNNILILFREMMQNSLFMLESDYNNDKLITEFFTEHISITVQLYGNILLNARDAVIRISVNKAVIIKTNFCYIAI